MLEFCLLPDHFSTALSFELREVDPKKSESTVRSEAIDSQVQERQDHYENLAWPLA